MPLWILILRSVRYISKKSHAHMKCGTLRKSSISTKGVLYVEIHIQRPFFDNKNRCHIKLIMDKKKSTNNIQDLGLSAASQQSIGRQPILVVYF
jgi:hypothetical protein